MIYLFIFLQTKRARISRETVDTDEESVAAFLEAPAAQSLPPLPNDPLDSDTTVVGDKVRPFSILSLFHPLNFLLVQTPTIVSYMDQTSDFPNSTTLIPDSGSSLPAAVCLPYSSVPGMDTLSQSYQRALVALSKQVTKPAPSKIAPLRALLDQGT